MKLKKPFESNSILNLILDLWKKAREWNLYGRQESRRRLHVVQPKRNSISSPASSHPYGVLVIHIPRLVVQRCWFLQKLFLPNPLLTDEMTKKKIWNSRAQSEFELNDVALLIVITSMPVLKELFMEMSRAFSAFALWMVDDKWLFLFKLSTTISDFYFSSEIEELNCWRGKLLSEGEQKTICWWTESWMKKSFQQWFSVSSNSVSEFIAASNQLWVKFQAFWLMKRQQVAVKEFSSRSNSI